MSIPCLQGSVTGPYPESGESNPHPDTHIPWYTVMLDVLLTVYHCTLMDQHQLDTLFLVCLLGVNDSVNTHSTHVITPNSICAEPPEDGRVTPETCRGIESQ
jgi:hypothetical protein